MKTYYFILTFCFLLSSCSAQELIIPHNNPELEYQGRVPQTDESATLVWPGTSVKIKFKGEALHALLKDENAKNYYNIIIDHNEPFILPVDSVERYYTLASNLPEGEHVVEIFKRTEWDKGKTFFKGFKITGNPELLKKDHFSKRKLEVYGNSISAGYAVDDLERKERRDSIYTNSYLAYPALLARHFNAEYRCICKSGIGLTLSWFPLTMPELYNRLDPTDSTTQWDFTAYQPNVVIVNLFQNDSWLVNKPERKEFKETFGKNIPPDEYFIHAYKDFISKIRSVYPQAHIICMLGNMDVSKSNSKWVQWVKTAVNQLNDDKIYTHIVPYKNTSGHPSRAEQQAIATSLIQWIEEKDIW